MICFSYSVIIFNCVLYILCDKSIVKVAILDKISLIYCLAQRGKIGTSDLHRGNNTTGKWGERDRVILKDASLIKLTFQLVLMCCIVLIL